MELYSFGRYGDKGNDLPSAVFRPEQEVSAYRVLLWRNDSYDSRYNFPYCAQLFASRDYVVYVIQPSGAIGYGQEFSARHVNAWGERTADEIIEGTKKFCAAHPFVNDKRIGCLGASYGGFMTMYLQTKTDMFAAAASHAGISNVTSYWGEVIGDIPITLLRQPIAILGIIPICLRSMEHCSMRTRLIPSVVAAWHGRYKRAYR